MSVIANIIILVIIVLFNMYYLTDLSSRYLEFRDIFKSLVDKVSKLNDNQKVLIEDYIKLNETLNRREHSVVKHREYLNEVNKDLNKDINSISNKIDKLSNRVNGNSGYIK